MGSDTGKATSVSVGIVGAGFGGLGMAIRLRQAGIADFTIFERGDSVGGTWRANDYPGATCDVPSHAYSFSFAPGTEWSHRYAPRADILDYLEGVVDKFELTDHLRFGTELTEASFDEPTGRWNVTTSNGDEHSFDVLVTACGQLTNPAIPQIPGLDDFDGTSFHSAEWDHDHNLSGRNVAVIGTGASAIQFAPAIAPEVGQMTIYQRSAPWILPKMDRAYRDWERALFRRVRARTSIPRAANVAFLELGTYAFTGDRVEKPFARVIDRYRRKELGDHPDLLAAATPDYSLGCNRVLFSSEWYANLLRDNVELVNGGAERITAGGVVGADGVERPADTIIWGTGFRSLDFVAPMRIHGLGGVELNERWGDRPEAYLGMTVAGFPNLFVLYGPNTNHGSGSVPWVHECQTAYALDGIKRLREEGARYIDLRPEVQAAWREEMEERSRTTKWITGGCHNWYLNEDGVNTNNWPGPWREYRRRTKRLNPSEYRASA